LEKERTVCKEVDVLNLNAVFSNKILSQSEFRP